MSRPADGLRRGSAWRRRLLALVAGTFVAAMGLFVWEGYRRLSLPPAARLEQQGVAARDDAAAALPDLADPPAFAVFLARLEDTYIGMDDRYRSFPHVQEKTSLELDAKGEPAAGEVLVEQVQYRDRKRFGKPVARRDWKTGKELPPGSDIAETTKVGQVDFHYPFSREAKAKGGYRYAFAGLETLPDLPDAGPLARLTYTPDGPDLPEGPRLEGSVWADPRSARPLRFAGRWVRPPFPIDRFEMRADYGLAETGTWQLRKVTTDGGGGFAFVSRRYLVTILVKDYRRP